MLTRARITVLTPMEVSRPHRRERPPRHQLRESSAIVESAGVRREAVVPIASVPPDGRRWFVAKGMADPRRCGM
jgi:hypothetical protein